MKIEIVAVGNELLNGILADTNTATLAGWLRLSGLTVHRGQTVPDEDAAIEGAFALAASRSDLVLVSGGLGPTEDDRTIACAARFAGVELVENAEVLETLKRRFERRGFPFTPNNARQALIPAGARALDNPVGTAPCVHMRAAGADFFFFPGVPRELVALRDRHLAPWLSEHAPVRPYVSHSFKTFGRTESQVATLLEGIGADPRLHVAYRAHMPEIHVTLHVSDDDPAAARALLDRATAEVRAALGPIVFTEREDEGLVDAIAAQLRGAGATLATAESCTGGLVAKLCTDVAGSSEWFIEGAVTYSNAAKIARLGVPEALIASDGAVSERVARAMAEGARERTGATYAVAITGVAGPGGGSEDKPVGTVHFALATPDGTRYLHRRLPFDRERNRLVSAHMALDMVRRELSR